MSTLSQPIFNPPLKGKKIVCFGDSITGNYVYPTYLAGVTGATVYNVGVGGVCMSNHTNPDYDPFCMTKLADAVATDDFTLQDASPLAPPNLATLKTIDFSTIDYAVIFFGANDYAKEILLGANSDNGNTTFKGSINYVISILLTAYPNIKLLFVAPPWRARIASGDGLESDTNPNPSGVYYIEYVDAMIESTNLKHIPCLDLYRNSGINSYTNTLYLRDGLHPTDVAGCELLGRKIGNCLKVTY